MDREQKATAVAELTEDLKGAEAIFAVDYRGISVTEAAELRGKLREADAVFKVVKNRLAKLAAADAGTADLDELLVGPTALTLIKGDAVLAAKAIADFAKEHEELEYKGGIMDGATLDPDGFKVIARLPGLDVLHGQVVMMVASPLTGLARGLGAMVSGLAIALGQIAEQGLVSGEPPAAEEPAAEEPAAEEAPAEAEPDDDATPTQPDPAEDEAPAEESSEGADAAEEAPAAKETSQTDETETEDEESSEEEPAAADGGEEPAEETESEDE